MSYPVSLCTRVRRLRELGGFSAAEIHRVLAREGLAPLPSVSTIKRWTRSEDEARRHAESQRQRAAAQRARRAGGRLVRADSISAEFRAARLRALVEVC